MCQKLYTVQHTEKFLDAPELSLHDQDLIAIGPKKLVNGKIQTAQTRVIDILVLIIILVFSNHSITTEFR